MLINNPYFIPYNHAMDLLGCSTHKHQLQKRMAKYANHFVESSNMVFISRELFDALQEYQYALRNLQSFKTKEVHNGNI